RGVAWNISKPDAREKLELSFTFPGADGDYFVMKKTVDEECCNPLRVWHDMGEPISLSMAQCELLREAANPLVTSERITASEGKLSLSLTINENGVVYFEVSPAPMKGDVGFDYERVMSI
ncbi:MAG: xylan 1,4-beta-xylosidase, partial [Eubacteriales bacterium]